jgi:hypothetical protein
MFRHGYDHQLKIVRRVNFVAQGKDVLTFS